MRKYSLILLLAGLFIFTATAHALDEKLAAEFNYLSGQTRQAMDLSQGELDALLVRCEQLQKDADSLQGSEKKIMGKKLRRMCGLFSYVLDSKRAKNGD
jgi:hypothetical protein